MTDVRDEGAGSCFDPVTAVDFNLNTINDSLFHFNSEGVFIPRESAVLVRCSLADTVHGLATPDDDTPCTLIAFDFQLDRVKATRTIHQAVISLILPDGVRVRKGGLAPASKVSFDPQAQSVSRNTEMGLSAGVSHGGTLTGNISHGESVSMDTTHYATVMGWTTRYPKPRPTDLRPHNCVKWALLENTARRDGVPPHFRAAVLLERPRGGAEDATFDIEMEISVKVDLKTAAEDITLLLGKTPRGCLRIDPSRLSTSNLCSYDLTHLASHVGNLYKLSAGALQSGQFSSDFS